MSNLHYEQRISELETALENLLECFDRVGPGRAIIEVTADTGVYFDGEVNQTTEDAITFAEEVLFEEENLIDNDVDNY